MAIYVLKKIHLPCFITIPVVLYYCQKVISFEGNSYALFYNNTASAGGAIYNECGNISFKEKSTTEFFHNIAAHSGEDPFNPYNDGGDIYSVGTGHITLEGIHQQYFINNIANQHRGAIFTRSYNVIKFCDNSTVTFS